LTTWQPCSCPGAQTLHPDEAIWGHFTVACREPGCRVGVVRPTARAGHCAVVSGWSRLNMSLSANKVKRH